MTERSVPDDVGGRIGVVDALRGLAALSVCWFHFTHGNEAFLRGHWLKPWGAYGWLGVQVFFVVSGFVIPFAMWRAEYKIRFVAIFLAKRVIRIDPPYLISIIVVIILHLSSAQVPGFGGQYPSISPLRLILHVGYLNAIAGYDWLQPVYWTLAIEFQYYILVSLLYPLLAARSIVVRLSCIGVMCCVSVIVDNSSYVFLYLGLFSFGILAFQFRARLLSQRGYLLCLSGVAAVVWHELGPVVSIAGLFAAGAIAFINHRPPKWLGFCGAVSYSLYLLHVPIGGRVINLGLRIADATIEKVVVLILAFLLSIFSAYVLYKSVERPSQKLSSSINYVGSRCRRV